MTNELTVAAGLVFFDGVVETSLNPSITQVDVASNIHISATVVLSSSREALPMGEVSTPGYALFENVGSEDVSLANDLTEAAFAVLQPGLSAQLPLGSATPYAWSDNGSTLRYLILSQ